MMEDQKRLFPGYGWLFPIDYASYLSDILHWVYDDSDPEDGTMIVRNEVTCEYRYVLEVNN